MSWTDIRGEKVNYFIMSGALCVVSGGQTNGLNLHLIFNRELIPWLSNF